jgi:DegV family protein with EDD domain
MAGVKIVADSTCDLSEDLIKKYDITIIPLNIVLDMKSYLDGVQITANEIYEWADRMNTTPKTAAPEMGYIINILKPFVEAGDEIIFFGISEEMSVTCNSVRLAAEEMSYQKIRVVNSRNLSTGIGLQVLRAAELAAKGVGTDAIVKEIEEARDKVRASFVIDTLTYLQRGGRCSAVTALLGNALKLKPMICVKQGKMGVDKKYRGKQQSVVRSYAKDLEPQLLQADSKRVFITHSGIDQVILEETYEYLDGLGHFDEILITRAGGVISSHCGPNTLGILFYEL